MQHTHAPHKTSPNKASDTSSNSADKPAPKSMRKVLGFLKYDLEYTTIDELREKIHSQSHFSILYFTLLIASVLVCTLGLLTDNTAVIIGGMLIAPLTWPLARIGFGIARRNGHHIFRGAMLTLASVLIGTFVAYLITLVSPIKFLNEEILSRTAPTLMDLFVALSAGLVAATAITQKKIADSLAGVAIAVSLMPPLCTVGITLGLRQYDFALGALLLFVVNAACITLVTALIISFNTYLRTKRFKIAMRAIIVNLLILVALAIPLGIYLSSYSAEIRSYNTVTSEIDAFATSKGSGAASFENIEVTRVNASTLRVSADLLIPNDSVFSFEDNEELVSRLEQALGGDVLLNLRIQTIIEPISKDQQDNQEMIELLRGLLTENLTKVDESYKISSLTIGQAPENEEWLISGEILTEPDAVPTSETIGTLSNDIETASGVPVQLNFTFLPQLTLRTKEQTRVQDIRNIVESATRSVDSQAEIGSFVTRDENGRIIVSYTVTAFDTALFNEDYIEPLQEELEDSLDSQVSINVRVVEAINISI